MFKISLTGDLGSGKSTVCDLIEKKIQVERVSVGKIMRARAKELGLTLEEFSAYMETHKEEDEFLDNALKEYEFKMAITFLIVGLLGILFRQRLVFI